VGPVLVQMWHGRELLALVNATDRSLDLAPSGAWGSIGSQESWQPEQQATPTPEPSGEGYRQQTGALAVCLKTVAEMRRPVCRYFFRV
jgi:hypothetical protein